MYKDWLESIASNKDLKWVDLRVFLTLLANIQGATAEISQTEIAQTIDVDSSNVSRSIRKLIENGIIRKKSVAGKLIGYRFLIEEQNQV